MSSSTTFRLRKHADYQRVYKAGRKQFGRQMAYFFALRDAAAAAHSDTEGPRIGLTVPKALGKAVARNRIKRRLREAVRAALPLLSAPVDVILHPKRTVLDADFTLIQREVETIFRAVEARAAQTPEARTAQAPATPPAMPRPSHKPTESPAP
ncbi:MAG TPA: ribonuclease P protein component [Acidobacteriaceae bacterium]|jgi:ribonuclease P protein component